MLCFTNIYNARILDERNFDLDGMNPAQILGRQKCLYGKNMDVISKKTGFAIIIAAFSAFLFVPHAQAGSIDFSGSSGNLSASVNFSLSGNTLTVTLTNTSTDDVLVPTDVLTGVFFNTTHTLTPVSANPNGSTVFYGALTNVGDGWGYAAGISAQGMNSAISATGAVVGLGHSNFSLANNALQGLDYGLLSAGDKSSTGNTGVKGHGLLIKDSVTFTLTAGNEFSLSDLNGSVVFQYGTDLSETHYIGTVPEPSLTLLLGIGFAAVTIIGSRWKK